MGVEFTTSEATDGNQTDVIAVGKMDLPEGLQQGFGSGDMVAEVNGRTVVLAVGSFCCGFLLLVGLDGLLGGGHNGIWF